MRVIEEGRVYHLRDFEGDDFQVVKFTRKRYSGEFSNGTTVEEVLRMLRSKFYHFNSISPSDENTACIKMCEAMLRECMSRLNKKKEDVSKLKSNQ